MRSLIVTAPHCKPFMMNGFKKQYTLLLIFIYLFQINSNAQNTDSTPSEIEIKFPTGTYYCDQFGVKANKEKISIFKNQIIRETTTFWKETYTDVYTVTHAYEYNKNQYFLFTETEETDGVSNYQMLLEFHEDAIYLSKTLYRTFEPKRYFDKLIEIKKLVGKAKTNCVYNNNYSSLMPYFSKQKYEAVKKLPTITETQLPEFNQKVRQQFFIDENDFNDFLYYRSQTRVKSIEKKLAIFNFSIESGFQPYMSNHLIYNYATSLPAYLKKSKVIRKSKRTGLMLFYDRLEMVSKILGGISLAWLTLVLLVVARNKKTNGKKILFPKFLKPVFSSAIIPGFLIIGVYFGFLAGWGLAQIITPNNDGGLADILLAILGIIPGIAGAIIFMIWTMKKLNKLLYKTS